MALPFFYDASINGTEKFFTLSEETSKHVVQVLRMEEKEWLQITNGKGSLFTATITQAHKKHCEVQITEVQEQALAMGTTTIGISLLKNAHRLEWFVEKATEMGINNIIPLLCQHTEKQSCKQDRLQQIIISAMLQSQQSWLPQLQAPTTVETVIKSHSAAIKLIAHCSTAEKQMLATVTIAKHTDCLILIGPEGDFSTAEINLALAHQFIPVSLGNTRLRTETAGMVATVLLKNLRKK
jgi:16S rRNA (uracil1498-N3)-methyltransferase